MQQGFCIDILLFNLLFCLEYCCEVEQSMHTQVGNDLYVVNCKCWLSINMEH